MQKRMQVLETELRGFGLGAWGMKACKDRRDE